MELLAEKRLDLCRNGVSDKTILVGLMMHVLEFFKSLFRIDIFFDGHRDRDNVRR